MRRFASLLLCAVGCAAATPAAQSQAFPAKPIRWIVSFEAASGGDVAARMLASKLSDALGQQMLVENRGGAGGGIAAELVARAAPDGHTLLFTTPNPQVIRPFLSKNISYDPVRDFTPITTLVETVIALIAFPGLPANTVKELVDQARSRPGSVSYGSSGIGSSFHLSGELLKQLTGVNMTHVPYKGAAPAIADMVAGRIQIVFTALASAQPLLRSGKAKILAVLASKRFQDLPQVPTMREALSGFEDLPFWLAMFGPAGVPQPVVERLHAETVKALKLPEIRDKYASMGFAVLGNTPEEAGAKLRRDIEVIGKIVKAAGLKPE